MAFEKVALPYGKDALAPHIGADTMDVHYEKHHTAYTSKLNDALAGTEFANKSIEEVLSNLSALPSDKQTTVRNNGGGYYNHNLFWITMSPNGGGTPSGSLGDAINNAFGSFGAFKEEFSQAAANRFGSGWAWLVVSDGKLQVMSTPNQDSPIMEGKAPILGIDVWEHAYYLNYQNRRPDYIAAWWNVVDWDKVAELYEAAR